MPHEPQTQEVHREMLELLKVFHRLCTDNGIRYSLHAGTMIGAVRDRGFIPWDDDIDVSLTRAEFEKFHALMQTSPLDGTFRYDADVARWPKLWMCRPGRPPVWIDVFIYDYITENRLLQKVKIGLLAILLGMVKDRQTMLLTRLRGDYTGWRYAAIWVLYCLGKPFSMRRKLRWAEWLAVRMGGRHTLVHLSNDRFCGLREVLPAALTETYVLLPFEDTELMVAAGYHEILLSGYGADYMTPRRTADGVASAHQMSRKLEAE